MNSISNSKDSIDPARIYRRFQGHEGPCHNVRYSPSGSLVASCSSDQTVRVWLPKAKASANHESVVLRGHSAAVKDVDFSHAQEHPHVGDVGLGRDQGNSRSLLLSCSDDKTLRVWDLSQPDHSFQSCLVGHTNWINACRFMPNSLQIAASGSDDGTIRLWDVSNSSNLVTYNVNKNANTIGNDVFNSVRKIEFHPSGSLLAASLGNGSIEIYDLRTDHLVHTFCGDHHSADTSSGRNANANINANERIMRNGLGLTLGLAFHPNGNHLMIGHCDGNSFSLCDLRSNEIIFTVDSGHGHDYGKSNGDGDAEINSSSRSSQRRTSSFCAFSNDGTQFITAGSGGNEKQVFVWSLSNTKGIVQDDNRHHKQQQQHREIPSSCEQQSDHDHDHELIGTMSQESRSNLKHKAEIRLKQGEAKHSPIPISIRTDEPILPQEEGNIKNNLHLQREEGIRYEEKESDIVDMSHSPNHHPIDTNINMRNITAERLDEALSQLNVLTQTVILLEQRISNQEDAMRQLLATKSESK